MRKLVFFFCLLPFFCKPQSLDTVKISKELMLVPLTKNIFMHISYADFPLYGRVASNGLIFFNNQKAFLFDTPINDSITKDLVSYINDNLYLEVIGFIPNHWHNDCMGGLSYLQSKNIATYAHQMTIDIARSKNLAAPAIGFVDSLELKLDDALIKCYYFGAAHSMDNIVVWLPSEQVLFAGCMVKSLESTNLGNTKDGDINDYQVTLSKLLKKFPSAKIVVPGHGKVGGLNLIEHSMQLAKKNR